MSRQHSCESRKRRTICQALACLVLGLIALPAVAQNPVVMVEEHWELVVADPDAGTSAPQTSMVMSPVGDSEGTFFMFAINHHSAPDFAPGGMQVQQWEGGDLVQSEDGHEYGTLSTPNETVTWTQRLTLENGQLTFGIHNGHSETWSWFGGWDLSISTNTNLSSLNAYQPAVSLSESQVSYAENRVSSLTLTKLVWQTADGEVHELSAPIPLDTSLDQ